MNEVIITAPSLDPTKNVSGVSSVVQFIIANNRRYDYVHFEMGKRDDERGGANRVLELIRSFHQWCLLLEKKPEAIVHYSFPLSPRSILRDPVFIKEAIKRGHPVLVHIHGGLYLTAEKIPYLQRHILERVFAWDVPFIVLSDMEKEQVVKRFGAKNVEVLPNCVELPDNGKVNANLNPNGNVNPKVGMTLGYLGRIEANKGMEELLEACRQLQQAGVNFRLEIAGKEEQEGTFLPRFESLLGNDFRYCGVVSGKDKEDFFRRMDVFVMPSYFEGLPMALLESMSYGVVPVVTPVGSIPQVVTDEKNGLLTKVKEVGSIVEAVKHLSANRALLDDMGQAAKETILNNFSTDEYIGKLNSLYEHLKR